jgi:hypothetical protein
MTTWTVAVEDVRLIFETSMENAQLQAFLDDAKALCDDVLNAAGYGDAKMNRIARYMAAHLASSMTPFTKEERIGDYQFERAGDFGEALKATSYGQAVLSLDTSGILDTLSKRPARMHVLIPTSEQ